MRDNAVLRVTTKIILPVILLFALYVQFHGDYGAGGGFQAGVIFAAGFILYGLIFGTSLLRTFAPPRVLRISMASGLILFSVTGFLTMALGSEYLNYDVLAKNNITGQHIGILIIELGVGITVGAVMITIFLAFAGRNDK